jgi:filamentous hemagglutinin
MRVNNTIRLVLALQLLLANMPFEPGLAATAPTSPAHATTTTVPAAHTAPAGTGMNPSQLTNLDIAKGSSVVFDFGKTPVLNLPGNLINSGTLYAISSNPAVTSATISAANIFNQQSGSITSVIPASGLTGYANLVGHLSLNLTALNNIVNAGSITSSANLSAHAGGSITNALPPGATGPAPIIQAANNLNMQALAITNAGTIAAQTGALSLATANLNNSGLIQSISSNVNIANTISPDLGLNVISSGSGLITAPNGTLSFGVADELTTSSMNIQGGTLVAKNLAFDAGKGHLNIDVQDLGGVVDIKACTADFGVANGTHDVSIHSFDVSGDPNIKILMTSGDFNLASGFSTDGGFIFVADNGNINFGGDINTTPDAPGSGGSVTLISNLSIHVQNITTSARDVGDAGDISLQSGADSNNITSFSGIDQTNPNFTITTGNLTANGAGPGNKSGYISIIPGNFAETSVVSVGTIDATGSRGADGGTVGIVTGYSQPNGTTIKPSAINVNGSIQTSATGTTGNAGNVYLFSGGDIKLASVIKANSGQGNGNGGAILMEAGTAGIGGISGSNISATGAGVGSGGCVFITAPGAVTLGDTNLSTTGSGRGGTLLVVSGTAGGTTDSNVSISAQSGALTLGSINTSGQTRGGDVILANLGQNGGITTTGNLITDATGPNGQAGSVGMLANGSVNLGSISARADGNSTSTNSEAGDIFISSGASGSTAITISSVNLSATCAGANNLGGNLFIVASVPQTGVPQVGTAQLNLSGDTPGKQPYFNGPPNDTSPGISVNTNQANNSPALVSNLFAPGGFAFGTIPANVTVDTSGDSRLIVPIVYRSASSLNLGTFKGVPDDANTHNPSNVVLLSSGEITLGSVTSNSSIDSNRSPLAPGGSIILVSSSADIVLNSGITGNIIADAHGTVGGRIVAMATGGITVGNPLNIVQSLRASGTIGGGGSIFLVAGTSAENNGLDINEATASPGFSTLDPAKQIFIDVSGSTAAGQVNLVSSSRVQILGTVVNANALSSGSGGNITIDSIASEVQLRYANANNIEYDPSLLANSSVNGGGNGGQIAVVGAEQVAFSETGTGSGADANQGPFPNLTTISAQALGTTGVGGSITVKSLYRNILAGLIRAGISADGPTGGTIRMTAAMPTNIVGNIAAIHLFTHQNITANGTVGAGGEILLTSYGSGVTFGDDPTITGGANRTNQFVSATGKTTGGTISIEADEDVTLREVSMDVSGGTGKGGTISISTTAGSFTATSFLDNSGTSSQPFPSNLFANSAQSTGGVISVEAYGTLTHVFDNASNCGCVSPTTIQIQANGLTGGGSITLKSGAPIQSGDQRNIGAVTAVSTTGTTMDLRGNFGISASALPTTVSTTSGTITLLPPSTASGGTITLSAAGDQILTNSLIASGPTGGIISVASATGFTLENGSNIDASGSVGRGGLVGISSSVSTATSGLTLVSLGSSGSPNLTGNSISAAGRTNGGSIIIQAAGALNDSEVTLDVSGTAGSGGTILLSARAGQVALRSFDGSPSSACCFDSMLKANSTQSAGGSITIAGNTGVFFQTEASSNPDSINAQVQANGATAGGSILILSASGTGSDLTGNAKFQATTGGTGKGGTISVVSAGTLSANAFDVSATAPGGAGGTLYLSSTNNLAVTTLNASGNGASGGSILLSTAQPGSGVGVQLSHSSTPSGTITLSSVDVSGSKAGSISSFTSGGATNGGSSNPADSNYDVLPLSASVSSGTFSLTPDQVPGGGFLLLSSPGGIFNLSSSFAAIPLVVRGDAGSAGTQLSTTATSLSLVTAGASSGNAFINNTGTLTLGPSFARDTLQVTNSNAITISTILSGTNVAINTGSNGGIAINGNVVASNTAASNQVTLAASGNGSISQTAGTYIYGPTIILSSGSGNIGNSSNNPLLTSTSSLTVSTAAPGSVFISNVGQPLSLGATSGSSQFNLSNTAGITTTGVISTSVLVLTTTANNGNIILGRNATGTVQATLSVNGSGSILQSADNVTLASPNLTLVSDSGNIVGIGGDCNCRLLTAAGSISATTSAPGSMLWTRLFRQPYRFHKV